MLSLTLLLLIIIVISYFTFVYFNGRRNRTYWKDRGVVYHNKNNVLGPFWDYLTKDRAFFEYLWEIYKKYPEEPAVGICSFLTPALYLRDPANVQHVLSTNFSSFNHRALENNEEDLLAENMLFLYGKKWKLMRQSLTPLFTTSKLKSMFDVMNKSAQDFICYLKEDPNLTKCGTFRNLSTYCCAAMGATVFGVTTESIFDSPFLKVATKAFRSEFINDIKFSTCHLSIELFKFLKLNLFKKYEPFFISAIKQVLRQRESERECVKKHDFADLCVNLQRNGTVKDESGYELELTDELLAAQALFFFVAGADPISAAMFGALVELGNNPEILQRLHDEIDDIFEKNSGNITYDLLINMEYLEMVVSETYRLHPPIGFVTRKCVKDSVLPVGNIKMDKGTKIYIPIYEFHRDPKFHISPEIFNPERFSRGNRHQITDNTYLPFGVGQRACLGVRYAQLQTKLGLVHLLRNFTVKTIHFPGGLKYRKDFFQAHLTNVDVEFINRNY